MFNGKADEGLKELFDSLKNRYQNELESIKGSEFVFNYVHFLYYKYHKTNPNCGRLYMDSPDWRKNIKATINPVNRKPQMFSICCNSCVRLKKIRKE